MKTLFILGFLFILPFNQSFDKLAYFDTINSGTEAKTFELLSKLKALATSNEKDAYVGALTMKSAHFLKTPMEKIEASKTGGQLLEGAINKEPKNVEFRFLRLIVQENAPKFLGYNKNIEEDCKLIKEKYDSLNNRIKNAVFEYAKKSTSLNL